MTSHAEKRPDPSAQTPAIVYRLMMTAPQTHYFDVEMTLTNAAVATGARKNGYYDIRMPVWTPGSYLIREYAKNVEGFTATTGNQTVRSEKIRKNAWRIYTGADKLTIQYRVYANEPGVRSSFIDSDQGFVTPASIFMYHNALKAQPLRVIVEPYKAWKTVTTALAPVVGQPNTFEAPNFDLLVDSPIEIGNHRTFSFMAANVPHTVAMCGPVNYDEKRLAADYARICETAASVVGEHPCRNYTFIVHHIPAGGGGLEHQNSSTLEVARNDYKNDDDYKGVLSIISHEYFHLWNVKRIRPIALGPFDYENENYTHLLWLSEGCTSFYQEYILLRAGYHTPEAYLNGVTYLINQIENQPGNRVQSAAESSWDAWIKGYRPNENSNNSTISYYNKGSVLGTLLNLAILSSSNGARNLDDLMKFLYQEYYKKQQRGFTDEEFRQAADQVAGRSLDAFFTIGVNSANPINYDTYFNPVGLHLVDKASRPSDGFLGASTTVTNGRTVVKEVRRGTGSYDNGLSVGDELVAIDQVRVGDNLNQLLTGRSVGDTLHVVVNRSGLLCPLDVTLGANPLVRYRLEAVSNPTQEQKSLYKKWLYTK